MADDSNRKQDADVSDAAKQPEDLARREVPKNDADSRSEQTVNQATSGPAQRRG